MTEQADRERSAFVARVEEVKVTISMFCFATSRQPINNKNIIIRRTRRRRVGEIIRRRRRTGNDYGDDVIIVLAMRRNDDDDKNGKDDDEATKLSRRAPEIVQRRTSSSSFSSSSSSSFNDWIVQDSKNNAKKLLKKVSSLPLAISEFAAIAGFSALGTVIEQNKSYAWYVENYPPGNEAPIFGLVDFTFILNNGLDHLYSTWYFVSLLSLLAVSLTACTVTKQLPVWRVAAKWKFIKKANAFLKTTKALDERESLSNARVIDLANALADRGYQVFLQEERDGNYLLYAFKGLIGRLAPIGVHAALLLTLGGCAYSGLGGLGGSIMAPKDTSFTISDGLTRGSPLSKVPNFAKTSQVFVKDFTIDYLPSGQVSQFYSDLEVIDEKGKVVDSKVISVNVPLRYGGVTMYQTDWSMSSMRVSVVPIFDNDVDVSKNEQRQLVLPMANLENKGDFKGKIWGTFLPLDTATNNNENKKIGISLVARDFQSVAIYDSKGSFIGVRRPQSKKPIAIPQDHIQLTIEEIAGSTGLELKTDPGVPFVYCGFAGLLVTSFLSLLSHSQVWGFYQQKRDSSPSSSSSSAAAVAVKNITDDVADGDEENTNVPTNENVLFVAGSSNRSKEEFRDEFNAIMDELPEYV